MRDLGALESALYRPQTGYYDSAIHEATALLENLVQIHPFVDGNKRVASAVTDVFLRINGYSIVADSKAVFDHLNRLFADHTCDMQHLTSWLQSIVTKSA